MKDNSKKAAAALLSYCAIVAGLLAITPWIDWSRYGSVWVATLAALPVMPGLVIALRRWSFSIGFPQAIGRHLLSG